VPSEFQDRLQRGESIEAIGTWLDGLSAGERLAQVRTLSRRDQAALFEHASGRACRIANEFVPTDVPPLVEVIHEGLNSMPMFRLFQKRFCRPSNGSADRAWGYNEQTMKAVTGPGYFVAHEADAENGVRTVVVDYRATLPTEKPEGWPQILRNDQRLSRFIYNGTQDWMWRVSSHVTIGRAQRVSGWMDNWFVLCRRDR